MKKWTKILWSVVCVMPTISIAQTTELMWAHSHGSVNPDMTMATVLDNDGGIYSTGHYNNGVNFGTGDDVFDIGGGNIFIQKLNGEGELEWVKNLSQTYITATVYYNVAQGTGIALDPDNNIITTGDFRVELDFDPGDEEYIVAPNGGTDVFIHKMNADGEFLWVTQIGDSGLDKANAITTDDEGNIYVTGTFSDIVDFDPDPDNELLLDANIIAGEWDSAATFILKLDADGNTIWVHGIPNNDKGGFPKDIITDSEHSVYITGNFTGLTDFGNGAEGSTLTGAHDCYLLKLDSEANFVWLQVLESPSFNHGYALAIENDKIYHAGQFGGTIDFDLTDDGETILTSTGINHAFVQKLETDGTLIWAKNIGGDGFTCALDIAVDTHGTHDLFVTGTFSNETDFDPNTGVYNLSAVNPPPNEAGRNMFFAQLSADSDFIMAEKIDDSNSGQANTILPTADGGLLITGQFYNQPDFDTTENEFNLDAVGNYDAFIAKYLFCENQSFSPVQSTLPDLFYECPVDEVPIPNATNTCATTIAGVPDLVFPITEEGAYTITWTYDNDEGQILSQEQNINIAFPTTEIMETSNYLTAVAEVAAYQWLDCDNGNAAIPGATAQDFYPSTSGNYAVEITSAEGCKYTSECVKYTSVGISENQFDTEITVYPNPSSGKLTINFNRNYKHMKIRLLDILGNEVQQIQIQDQHQLSFMITAAKGWYFIEMENEFGEIARAKILKN